MTDSLVLTNSEAGDFADCRRRWWLGVYRGLGHDDRRFNSPLSIGSAYHDALAAKYGAGVNPVTYIKEYYRTKFEDLATTFNELFDAQRLTDLEKESDLVTTMVEGYEQYLEEEGADSELEVLGAEETVRVPLTNEIMLQGKIDAPARWKFAPHLLLQLEHKTLGGHFSDITSTAQGNTQFRNYDLLTLLRAKLSQRGERTDGLIINMARKVKRTARAKPPFFARHEVRHSENELRSHWKHMVAIGTEIIRTRARLDAGEDPQLVVPPRVTKDCTWKCPFAAPCLSGMFDDGSDFEGYLSANFEAGDPLERYARVEKMDLSALKEEEG